ncbi:hypothetical protein HX045_07060 [Myroides odoratimimus]|uniref:hypothetical protein n=2 Tax=Myroides odoratimimus TaxID=76832 RepID=UPI001CE140F7|nr:hypothetical protein [Myroides odoratimimus]MCA4792977.1 hypothetical protein [Myroides odoratimimus]MCA4820152.1 hypothetical protein [Myroides odoratimimus]MDM1400538.1 hypothetical protein [Myroides odoratimimus]MDM1410877.1 hypothetical protein [Myroides odoratimimus]MDM1443421.1 hypothetical protein [Myroides odoratimimus]
MRVLDRIVLFLFITGINCIYARQEHVYIDKYAEGVESNELQHSVELIMTHLDIDAYYQYVDFDNIALKESTITTSHFVYLIPYQTSSTSDWNVCIAILNEANEIVISGVAKHTWDYQADVSFYPVISFDQPYIYNKNIELNITVDILKTGEVEDKEVVSNQKLVFVPNQNKDKLINILQYEYNTVLKHDDAKGYRYSFSVNNNDKLTIESEMTEQFYNLNLVREHNISISTLPQLKQKCTIANQKAAPFLVKEQREDSFLTAYFVQRFTEAYIYYKEEEKYKPLSAVVPRVNILSLYEKCMIQNKP